MKAANQLGLQYYTLAEWRKNRKAETKLPDPATDAEQQARIRELERECNELRQANEILKDALGFSFNYTDRNFYFTIDQINGMHYKKMICQLIKLT